MVAVTGMAVDWIGVPTGVAVMAIDPDAVVCRTDDRHDRGTVCRNTRPIATGLKGNAIGPAFLYGIPTRRILPDGQIT
jgi:hypothetical protein